MKYPILCINGSDSTGHSGIQADIKTIKDMGGYAMTAVTSVTVQNQADIHDIHELPTELVTGQVKAVYEDVRPAAVKIGMTGSPDTIRDLRNLVVGCRHIVCSPGILSSHGGCMMSDEAIAALRLHLIPICTMIMLKCKDAEILLRRRITTDDDVRAAAHTLREMGAEWVLLRGGTYAEGRINALLCGEKFERFFSSVNIEGWQRHGVAGTISTAIATRLAMGDDVPTAVQRAHDYLHRQVVYANPESHGNLRPHDLYNALLSLIADNYCTAHDVAFYAERLAITTRYLSQITKAVSGRSPKQIIDSYLLQESERMIVTTTLSIQEIAIHLGFSSQVTFAKFIKAKKGCTPTALRSLLASE